MAKKETLNVIRAWLGVADSARYSDAEILGLVAQKIAEPTETTPEGDVPNEILVLGRELLRTSTAKSVFITSDGVPFYHRADAEAHAKKTLNIYVVS